MSITRRLDPPPIRDVIQAGTGLPAHAWAAWFKDIHNYISDVRSSIGRSDVSIGDINSAISGIREQVASIQTTVSQTTIIREEADLTEINTQVTSINNEINALQTVITNIQNEIDNLPAPVSYSATNPVSISNNVIGMKYDSDTLYLKNNRLNVKNIWHVNRKVGCYKDSCAEVGYFTVDANEPFSFDVEIRSNGGSGHTFAGMFHIEGYANDTGGEWQIVPAAWWKGDNSGGQEYCVEMRTDSDECRIRIRKLLGTTVIGNRFSITIDKDQVSGTLTNFLFLFSEDINHVPQNFWDGVTESDGSDIRFYDSDETTELKREIVTFDKSGKIIEAWIQIPSLSSSSDKVIYCTYGGDTTTNDATIWTDVGHKSVYHLKEDDDDDRIDSAYSISLTPHEVEKQTGKIADSANFYNIGYLVRQAASQQEIVGDISISVWIYLVATSSGPYPNDGNTIVVKKDDGIPATLAHYYLVFYKSLGKKAYFVVHGASGNAGLNSTADIPVDTWTKIDATCNASGMKIYINGVLDSSGAGVAAVSPASNQYFAIGGAYRSDFGYHDFFYGRIDELRLVNAILSQDEITTSYNNQNDPASFATCSTIG